MAATDPITVETKARSLIEKSTRHNVDPVLATTEIDLLLEMAASDDGNGGTHYTVADLNRVVSLGWSWKAATASQEIKVGVGPGKTFESQMAYDHCVQMMHWYSNGTLSVVGSADASDGTSQNRSRIGSVTLSSVMNT